MTAKPVTIYYDGECPLCSREVAHHRDRTKGVGVAYIDIAASDFDPAAHGVDRVRVQEVLHVKVGDVMLTGTDAVIAIWDAVPSLRWLARFARLPGIYTIARLAYRVFARVRPYLQRRRQTCDAGSCR